MIKTHKLFSTPTYRTSYESCTLLMTQLNITEPMKCDYCTLHTILLPMTQASFSSEPLLHQLGLLPPLKVACDLIAHCPYNSLARWNSEQSRSKALPQGPNAFLSGDGHQSVDQATIPCWLVPSLLSHEPGLHRLSACQGYNSVKS